MINRWSRGKRFPLRLIQRAQIIQLASQGILNHDIAKRLNISRPTVQLWRERFLALRLAGLAHIIHKFFIHEDFYDFWSRSKPMEEEYDAVLNRVTL